MLGAQEYVTPDLTAWDLGRALLVGVLLGVLGGLYPAWRAARVSPAQVLAQKSLAEGEAFSRRAR